MEGAIALHSNGKLIHLFSLNILKTGKLKKPLY